MPLTVRPSTASLPPPPLPGANPPADNLPPPAQDIIQIKARPGRVAQVPAPVVAQPWFLALQGVPVAAWLGLFLARKQREKLANNPRLRRQRQVEQSVREGMRELGQAAAAGRSEAYFATLFRLLQERIGERLDLPASAITEAVLEERLRPGQLPENVVKDLQRLFHVCNQARYARQTSSAELVSLTTQAGTVLEELRRWKA